MWETDGRTFDREVPSDEYFWITPCGNRVRFKLLASVSRVWERIDLHEKVCEVCNS